MEHGLSWETNSCTAGQDDSSIPRNAKFHYRVHTTRNWTTSKATWIHAHPPNLLSLTPAFLPFSSLLSGPQCDYIPSGVPQHNATCFPLASAALLCLVHSVLSIIRNNGGMGCNDNWEIWINQSTILLNQEQNYICNLFIKYTIHTQLMLAAYVNSPWFCVSLGFRSRSKRKKLHFPPSSLVIISLWSCKDSPRTDNQEYEVFSILAWNNLPSLGLRVTNTDWISSCNEIEEIGESPCL
jgi:hypothetical protein